MMVVSSSESSLSPDNISDSIPEALSENVENYLMELYHSTVNKYSDGQISISDP